MVSGTLRKQIIYGALIGGCIIALSLFISHRPSFVVKNTDYVATNDALDLAVLNGIVTTDKTVIPLEQGMVKAVVVPHHLIAGESIARGIKSLASSRPRVVVIISPDHYAHCPTILCTTHGNYKSFFGNTPISTKHVDQLEKSKDIVSESELFTEEHGVYTIVPFIKHYIPEAQIIPIAISQQGRGSPESRAEIVRILRPLLSQKDVSLVISSDFSHYLSLTQSNQMDAKTQNSFCSGDSEAILNLHNPDQSDCPLCLWILEQEAQELGFWHPSLIAHTNSADLLHDKLAQETTSHFVFTLSHRSSMGSCPVKRNVSQQDISAPPKANILFVGDMMFDRYIRDVTDRHSGDFLFSCIDPVLQDADFVVGNLEGPITDHQSVSRGTQAGTPENYRFTFPPTTADLLARHNIKLVSIGNNHIDNYGLAGISSTRKYLSAAGVGYFGGLAGDDFVHRITSNGMDLSFVNYNQFGGDPVVQTAERIASEHAQGRVVVVYAHWGEEYIDTPESIRAVAKLFADSGASLIIGSHPHVVQGHEMVSNTPVYYSLGNFIFDQYFDAHTTKGLTVLAHIAHDKITIDERPIQLNRDGRTCPL